MRNLVRLVLRAGFPSGLLALVLVFGGVAPGQASPVGQTSRPGGAVGGRAVHTVSITDFGYQPSSLVINVGDTVTWTNVGVRNHTATSAGVWDSGIIPPLASFSFTFPVGGTYSYRSLVDSIFSYSGTVQVVGSAATATPLVTSTPVPPLLGGRAFTMTSNSAVMSWNPNGIQTAFYVLRYLPGGAATFIAQLPLTANSFTAPGPFSGMYCNLVVSYFTTTNYGLSDMLCRIPGGQSGQSVGSFSIVLNQGNTASFTWTGAPGTVTDYQLTAVPLDGSALRTTTIAAGQTSATDATGGKATCYLLATRNGTNVVGVTDPMCGVPGISNLGNLNATGARAPLDTVLRSIPSRVGR